MRTRTRAILVACAAVVMSPFLGSGDIARAAGGPDVRTIHVGPADTLTVSSTRTVSRLVIEDGGRIEAPSGYELTLTPILAQRV